MTRNQQAVINAVNNVPYGKVVSYGQVALYIGSPKAARQVGWILRSLEGVDMPWWRVKNNTGRISIKGNKFNTPADQKARLEAEGIVVSELFEINIEKYRYLFEL
jgi:methylated-DNA-protein-cysteine methyltransferase related protein